MTEPTSAHDKAHKEELFAQLAELPDEPARREFLARNPHLFKTEVVTALADQAREKIRVDVRQALSLAEAALVIAAGLDNKESLARALRAKANVLYARGEHAAAVDLHEQAAAWFDSAGQTHEVARTLSGSIQPMLLLGWIDPLKRAGHLVSLSRRLEPGGSLFVQVDRYCVLASGIQNIRLRPQRTRQDSLLSSPSR